MTDQTGDGNNSSENNEPTALRNLAQTLRCPTAFQRSFCEICRNARGRLGRHVTLRGLPRLFLLRRAFCFYWICLVISFLYLKLYFPLYLTSTVNRSTLRLFQRDWCRMRQSRVDWRGLLEWCPDGLKSGSEALTWSLENRTQASKSFISFMDVRPAGEFSRFSIQSQTYDGRLKTCGGDWWRVYVHGPSTLAPSIIDHGNGTYEVLFLVMEAGDYLVDIQLDSTLCSGLVRPALTLFASGKTGKVHSIKMANETLGANQDYTNKPLGSVILLTISIPHAAGPMRSDEFLSSGLGSATACGEHCKFLWDGYGRWVNGTWKPHVREMLLPKSPRKSEGLLWILGGPAAAHLHKSVADNALCRRIFKRCDFTAFDHVHTAPGPDGRRGGGSNEDHFDVYSRRVLNSIRTVVRHVEMDDKSVLLLDHGLHIMLSANLSGHQRLIRQIIKVLGETRETIDGQKELIFKGKVIWKTTAALSWGTVLELYHLEGKFLTAQRIALYNAFAASAFCSAGMHVLDLHPISESHSASARDESHHVGDSKYVESDVIEPVVTLLRNYFEAEDYEETWNVSTGLE